MIYWWSIIGLIFLAGCFFGYKTYDTSGPDSIAYAYLTLLGWAVAAVLAAVTGILQLIF